MYRHCWLGSIVGMLAVHSLCRQVSVYWLDCTCVTWAVGHGFSLGPCVGWLTQLKFRAFGSPRKRSYCNTPFVISNLCSHLIFLQDLKIRVLIRPYCVPAKFNSLSWLLLVFCRTFIRQSTYHQSTYLSCVMSTGLPLGIPRVHTQCTVLWQDI